MRIVFVFTSAELGGAERSLTEQIQALSARQPTWELHAILPAHGALTELLRGTLPQLRLHCVLFPHRVAATGQNTSALKAMAILPAAVSYLWQLRRLLRQIAPDWVHSNGNKAHLACAWARPSGTRQVVHLRDYPEGRLTLALLKASKHRIDVWLAISFSVAKVAQDNLGLTASPQVRYNALPVALYAAARGAEARGLPLAHLADMPASAAPTVGLVATYAHWKGHEVFLEALAKLPGDLPFRAYLIGGSIYATNSAQQSEAALRQKITTLGLSGKVGLVPFQKDAAAVFAALDVVVHASTKPEPFGRVIVEGMATQCAVIAADAGGAREVVSANVTALVHRPGDALSLSTALYRLLSDASHRQAIATAGQDFALNTFARRDAGAELAEIYR